MECKNIGLIGKFLLGALNLLSFPSLLSVRPSVGRSSWERRAHFDPIESGT